jgi:hypothetical protein
MKELNMQNFQAFNPTLIHSVVNQRGQTVHFYDGEDGDLTQVIAVFPKENKVFETDFFDTEDFHPNSDYNPILIDGLSKCAFECL